MIFPDLGSCTCWSAWIRTPASEAGGINWTNASTHCTNTKDQGLPGTALFPAKASGKTIQTGTS